ISVNDFGAIGDGTSHPLSESYSTLAAAKVDYPAARSLSDEKDWCAWQAAADFLYKRDATQRDNWAAGSIVARGQYVVNRTITFNLAAVRIEGQTMSATRSGVFGHHTSITYNGSNGTVDAPVYIFDSYLFDEFGHPPPGRNGNDVLSGGGKTIVAQIVF